MERVALWVWLVLGGGAIAGLTLGVFWWWMVLGVTIPFVLLAFYAPTAFLYMTVTALPYVLARLLGSRWADWRMLLIGATIAAAAGLYVPRYANRATASAVAAIEATEIDGTLKPSGSVALLDSMQARSSELVACDDQCQRLLFTGAADAVLIGPADALTGPVPVTRYSFVPIAAGCMPFVSPAYFEVEGPVGTPRKPPRRLSEQLAAFGAEGLCLRGSKVRGASADVALIDRWQVGPARSQTQDDLRLASVNVLLTRILLRRDLHGWRTVARHSLYEYHRLSTPLTLWPKNGADTSVGTRWGGKTIRVDHVALELTKWLDFDDRVFTAAGTPTVAADRAVARAATRTR